MVDDYGDEYDEGDARHMQNVYESINHGQKARITKNATTYEPLNSKATSPTKRETASIS